MKSIKGTSERIIGRLTSIVVILMMIHVVANALMRFFLNAPIYGTNELVEYWYLPAIALLGIPVAQMQREHITVTLLFERMNQLSRRLAASFAFGLSALLAIAFAWFGFDKALSNFAIGSTAGVTDILTWPVYFLVPVVFILLFILCVVELFHAWKSPSDDAVTKID